MTYEWYHWNDLTKDLLYESVWLRLEVFVTEQKCYANELDHLDQASWHLFGRDDKGELVAYLRLVAPGKKFAEPALGRIVTAQSARGIGLGKAIMLRGIEKSKELYPGMGIRLSAQVYARRFYEKLGFRVVGKPYDEDGIMHIEMLRED